MSETKEVLRDIPLEVKATDDGAHTFRGLAAAWSLDLGNDVIHKGAFKHTLNMWQTVKQRKPIYLLNGHKASDVRDVVGKLVDARETEDGLETEWEFVKDDPAAEAAFRRVKGGFITGMSIGYTPTQVDFSKSEDGKKIRNLRQVKLHEVSLVVFPMNEDARVDTASIKTLAQWTDMNDEERKAYIDALPEDDKAALRALLAPPAPPEPEAAHEDIKRELANDLLRLNLQLVASRSRGPASVGQTIATIGIPHREQEDRRKAG